MLTDPFHTERIYTLWDELADLGAAGTEEARRHLLSTVADMVQARQADW